MKWLAVIIGSAVLLLLGVGLAIPSHWHVEQSIDIAAPPARTFALVSDFHSWPEWTEWSTRDEPEAKLTITGDHLEWHGRKLGNGIVRMTGFTVGRSVSFSIEFEAHEPSKGTITVEPSGSGSRVTWALEGDAGRNPLAHLLLPRIRADLGGQLHEDLERLAEVSKTSPAPASAPLH